MSGYIKSIQNPQLKLEVLSKQDILKIHNATLEIIQETGVKFPSKKALDIWEKHGAKVDRHSMVVKAPKELIEDALKECPPAFTLAAREPAQSLDLDGNHVYVGTDGCGIQIIDLMTSELRRTKLADVADIARIGDAVEDIAFHWVAVSAQDKPPESRGLHEIKAVWENSTKHVQTESIYHESEALAAVEMARILSGGSKALRENPPLSIMQCTIPPLGHDGGSLEAALVFAEAGIPVGFMTMTSCLTTAPATLAGNLVVGNAEVLSAAALIQIAYPGAPFFYAAAQTSSDLRTGAYTGGGPEDFLFGAATNELSNFYNLPLSMGSFATGAKEPNWQAGVDNSLSTFMASISMSDMLLGVGLLHGSRIWSYEQMMLDCEIFDIIFNMMQGIVVDDETLALDVIKSVGPQGNYLSQRHTLKHMRNLWVPKYMDRRPYEIWSKEKDGPREWAKKRALEIYENHRPNSLDQKIIEEFNRIIQTVERHMVNN
jgi:trimethylamine--corrinoid protein Co-methyltransferase